MSDGSLWFSPEKVCQLKTPKFAGPPPAIFGTTLLHPVVLRDRPLSRHMRETISKIRLYQCNWTGSTDSMAEMEKLVPTVQSYEAPKPIWEPCTPPEAIPMNQYRKHINEKFNVNLKNSQELQKWSITSPQEFWIDLWSYVGIVPELAPSTTRAYDPAIPIDKIPPFFEGSVINYAENVLNQPQLQGNAPALIGLREGQGLEGERWSWAELREQVRVIRSALKRSGTKEGDRVAALISTSVWSVAIFLAAASLGAIYTSIASDLGADVSVPRQEKNNPELSILTPM